LRRSLGIFMLLRLRIYLKQAYNLSDKRIDSYSNAETITDTTKSKVTFRFSILTPRGASGNSLYSREKNTAPPWELTLRLSHANFYVKIELFLKITQKIKEKAKFRKNLCPYRVFRLRGHPSNRKIHLIGRIRLIGDFRKSIGK